MSAVSVLVMDCTTIGASEPTRTPPTMAVTVFLRGMIAMGTSILACEALIDSATGCPQRNYGRQPGCPQRGDLSLPATPACGKYPELVVTNVGQSRRPRSASSRCTA